MEITLIISLKSALSHCEFSDLFLRELFMKVLKCLRESIDEKYMFAFKVSNLRTSYFLFPGYRMRMLSCCFSLLHVFLPLRNDIHTFMPAEIAVGIKQESNTVWSMPTCSCTKFQFLAKAIVSRKGQFFDCHSQKLLWRKR